MDRPHLAAGRIGILLLALPATGRRRVHRGDGRRRAHAAPARRRPGRRRARLVAAVPRLDDRAVGGPRRPLAGADQQPGHRLPQHGARPPADAGTSGRLPDRRRRGGGGRRPGGRAPRRRIRRRHAVPAHRTGRPARAAGGHRPRDAGRPLAGVDRPARGRRAGRREPGRGDVRAALVVGRGAPDRDRRPRPAAIGTGRTCRRRSRSPRSTPGIPAPRSSSASPLSPAGPARSGWRWGQRSPSRHCRNRAGRSRCRTRVSSGCAADPATGPPCR